jgi:hypothetical protein
MVRAYNGLWFTSLGIALVVALLSILAKQWLTEYVSRMRAPAETRQRWAWRHRVFRQGLDKWQLDAFISSLPFLIHVSLFLFFAGLVAFLYDLDRAIAGVLISITALTAIFYTFATMLPLWFGDCPSATPLLRQCRVALQALSNTVWWLVHSPRGLWAMLVSRVGGARQPLVQPWSPPAWSEENLFVGAVADRDTDVLRTMLTTFSVAEEVNAALEAIGSMDLALHRHLYTPFALMPYKRVL